jgi:ADP-heptose:LPS heptosyltransferase
MSAPAATGADVETARLGNPGEAAGRVLVIKLSALGDFVMATGAMKAIRQAHPTARITLLTTPPFEALAKASPWFDLVETDGRPRRWQDLLALIRRLRKDRYDIVYDLQTSGRTQKYILGLWPKAPLWSGVGPGVSHPHANPARLTMHPIDRLAEQLWMAGLGPAEGWQDGAFPRPDLSWIGAAFGHPPRFTPEFFSVTEPFALIIPGASAHRPEKRWPAEAYIELARRLNNAGLTPVLIGAKSEAEIGQAIARQVPEARSLIGRTDLFQIAALASRAKVAIGNDTGPMHMSAAAGAPTLTLFATQISDPFRNGPRGPHPVAITTPTLETVQVDAVWRALVAMGLVAH